MATQEQDVAPPRWGWRRRWGGIAEHPRAVIYLLVGSTASLLALGLIMVWSSSAILSIGRSGDSWNLVSKQALFALGGVTVLFVLARMRLSTLQTLSGPLMLITIALLVLVLIPGIGVEVGGQRNWISLGGPFRLQPSEFAKVAFIVWSAGILASRHRLVTDWKTLLMPVLPVGTLIMGLIVLEGDFGNAMIIGVIMAGLLYFAGAPLRFFAGMGAVAAVGTALLVAVAPYRMNRLTAFLNPDADQLDELWQVTQGMYAFGSGGLFGLGLGASREKWGSLPEAHTDFIFPVVGEELGLVGTVTVLLLFGVLIYAMVRIMSMTNDRFIQFLSGGVAVWIMIQVITNIGASLKLLPLTGVTLPFLSYGGSSMLTVLAGVGIVLAAAKAAVGPPRRSTRRARPSHRQAEPAPATGGR